MTKTRKCVHDRSIPKQNLQEFVHLHVKICHPKVHVPVATMMDQVLGPKKRLYIFIIGLIVIKVVGCLI